MIAILADGTPLGGRAPGPAGGVADGVADGPVATLGVSPSPSQQGMEGRFLIDPGLGKGSYR